MYRNDQPAIASMVAVGEDGWENRAAGVALTALFTVKTQTQTVLKHTENFRDKAGNSIYMQRRMLWGAIQRGEHVHAFRMARASIEVGDYARALLYLCALDGLGLAKAGFTLQMIWGVTGCIDTRNAEQFGVKAPKSVKSSSDKVAYEHAARYVALCDKLGGSEYLWDNWCMGVANSKEGKRYNGDGDALSREHTIWVANILQGMGM